MAKKKTKKILIWDGLEFLEVSKTAANKRIKANTAQLVKPNMGGADYKTKAQLSGKPKKTEK